MAMGKLVAVFLFSTLLVVAFGGKQDKPTEQSSPSKSSTQESISKLFGINGTYANVHRKNHPQGRSKKIYNLSLEVFDGKSYLVGTSSAENHSATYMYRMDDVQLITFPNPDYEKPESPKRVTSNSSSLRQQVIQSKKDLDRLNKKRHGLKRAVSNKKQRLIYIKTEMDGQDQNQDKIQAQDRERALLESEVTVYETAIAKLESEIEKQRQELVKIRSDAVSKGIFDSKFE